MSQSQRLLPWDAQGPCGEAVLLVRVEVGVKIFGDDSGPGVQWRIDYRLSKC